MPPPKQKFDKLAKENISNLYDFKHISKPKAATLTELKRAFVMLELPEGLIINPNTWDEAIVKLLEISRSLTDKAYTLKTFSMRILCCGETCLFQ